MNRVVVIERALEDAFRQQGAEISRDSAGNVVALVDTDWMGEDVTFNVTRLAIDVERALA